MSVDTEVGYEAFGESHLPGVVALCAELDWPSYLEPSIARAALSAPGAVSWVAVVGGRVVGLAHLLTNGQVHSHLSLIGVSEAFRRRGIARELLTRANRMTGAKWVDLVSVPGSEEFYRSMPNQELVGFRIYPGEGTS